MTDQTPISLETAFIPADTPSFAWLIETLPSQTDLSETRKRDMISGLTRVATALGLPPGDVPCHGRWLQPRLARINPVAHGITLKTWQNATSNARAAMAHVGIVERRWNRRDDLTAAWQALWTEVLATKRPHLSFALCRFVHFLSRHDIAPDAVTLDHAHAYREAVAHNEISKDPDRTFRAAIDGWNLASRTVPGWPAIVLTPPSRLTTIVLERAAFDAGFLDDLDRLMAWLAAPDPLSDDPHARALRPATLTQYQRQILRFASELIQDGLPPERLTAVADLLDPATAERGLRLMLARNGNQSTRAISDMAGLLRMLARRLGAEESTRERLVELAARLAVKQQPGMTAKNRTRLRVLQDPTNQLRLFQLPDRIFARPTGKARPQTVALAREDGLAIAILLVCPLRIKNLAELRLDRHIQRPGDGRVYLVLEEEDTKTGRPLEFELPRDVVRLLDDHLATRCPRLCPPGTPFLFPRRSGDSAIGASELAMRISRRVRKETGLEVNAHLFRHFAVMTWLDANPGGYEVARRLLGHSELSHTINLYSGLEIKSATHAFSELVGTLKTGEPA